MDPEADDHRDEAATARAAALDHIDMLRAGPFPWWMRGGHLETILASALPLPVGPLEADRRLVAVGPGTRVETFWSAPPERVGGSLLVVHGLGGSAERPHVVAMADAAVRRGWHAVRVNLRNHGGTERLASTLFSAVQSDDLGAVLTEMEARGLPRPYVLVGGSLGANMALRYAALAGESSRADAVVAMNPALDFFVIEREIHRPSNLVYRLNFILGLCGMLDRIRAVRPVPGPPADLRYVRSIRDFDGYFTAPAAGFPDVDAYYESAGAGAILGGLRVPAYLLTARNDPFIPAALVAAHHGAADGRVRVAIADRGGHVGYRTRGEDGAARFWAAGPVFDWIESTLGARR
ncbi:MAG: YheT family hydrolase [Dehalococcoidia bacterium]